MRLLPFKADSAAHNMIEDVCMLEHFPYPSDIRFRHYGWMQKAYTFGYSQKWACVMNQVNTTYDLCRRPTGGGIVDHTSDWTYSLVIPATHAYWRQNAMQTYKDIHEALASALQSQSYPATVLTQKRGNMALSEVCFHHTETYDVLCMQTGKKIAGAAQKRNRHGLLVQGSIIKSVVKNIDWDLLYYDFTNRLSDWLKVKNHKMGLPHYNAEDMQTLLDKIRSPSWNQKR